jgi:acetyl esterase/lipase
MRKILRIVGVVVLIVVLGVLGVAGYYLLWDAPHPPARPDLASLPPDLPRPPWGFPTLKAGLIGAYLGLIDIVDIKKGPPVPAGVIEHKDIEYGRVGDRALQLDLYSPEKIDKPAPALIFIHGGGWKNGNRTDYKIYTVHFAKLGYVVATVGYRFVNEAPFPACVQDVKCAVRYLRAHAAELKIDPDRMAAIGGSAGGHLAMMLGYTPNLPELEGDGGWPGVSSAVAAVVDEYGPTDFTVPFARIDPTITGFIQKSYAEAPERYELASPIAHVTKNSPPTLIIHGTIDDIVPIAQSDKLAEKFKELGVPYWYDRISGYPHTMDIVKPMSEHLEVVMDAFFKKFMPAKQ